MNNSATGSWQANSRGRVGAAQNHANSRKRPADTQEAAWVADEDRFVLQQAKKKAEVRVKEDRAKPIDRLAVALRFVDPSRNPIEDEVPDAELQVVDPEAIFEGLDDASLDELERDIGVYITLEESSHNKDFWQTMETTCKDRRQRAHAAGRDGRGVEAVSSNVDRLFTSKSLEELESLEKQIRSKLQSEETVDNDYWESLLRTLRSWKAKTKLRQVSSVVVQAQLKGGRAQRSKDVSPNSAAPDERSRKRVKTIDGPEGPIANKAEPNRTDDLGSTSALYEREVARGVGQDEEIFAGEEVVSSLGKQQWKDKYRPRKPRYFNRVQMGYEWNKYNQTHYDHDNPPPKVVQGYKFNVFYPDLIDRTRAPTYKIERENGRKKGESFAPAGEEDTCLIRFVSGPPYEDVAFRIVDKEWDYSAKRERGFKSSFDKVGPSCRRPLRSISVCANLQTKRAYYNCTFNSRR